MPGPVAHSRTDTAWNVVARDAVARLLEEHGPRIFALAQRLCGNRADAEDLVQDVFLQASRKWHTFRGEADPGPWLYSIAARSCKGRMPQGGPTAACPRSRS